MHHLSQFLVLHGGSRKKKKTLAKPQPKLERMNARRNIDYEIPATSTSDAEECCVRSSGFRGNQLFDIPTSFRIDGSDVDQLELVYRTLGLESCEDLGIPIASWEASKIRSSSDLIPTSRLNLIQIEHDTSAIEHERRAEHVEKRCDDIVRVFNSPVDVEDKSDVVNVKAGGRNGVRNRIKGVRPPVLTPPVITKLLIHHDGGCEWDNVRNFRSHEGSSALVIQQRCGLSDEDVEEADAEDVSMRVERGTLSASCSFTTSNDDDSSSSTTEPPLSVSPDGFGCNVSANGRFQHITITHWQRGELLGRGSFGSVYEGICDGGYFIAVKEVSLLDQGELGRQSVVQLEQEIDLLSQFEHDNIVRYYGTDKDESKLYIFLELVTKGSLLSLYKRYHLQDCQVSSYTRQILHGLKYLHDRGVVHRDVKCANILVDANGSVKLADFGLAKVTKFNDVKSCKGTAFWMAPEVVNQKNKGYGLAADIWSLGCTVLEMLTQRIPYSPMEGMAALYSIGNGTPPPVPDNLSREARDFIFQCFHVNPSDRPTASQLLDHPFVKSPLPPFRDYASPRSSNHQA